MQVDFSLQNGRDAGQHATGVTTNAAGLEGRPGEKHILNSQRSKINMKGQRCPSIHADHAGQAPLLLAVKHQLKSSNKYQIAVPFPSDFAHLRPMVAPVLEVGPGCPSHVLMTPVWSSEVVGLPPGAGGTPTADRRARGLEEKWGEAVFPCS